jgi:hypothetical protein
MEQHYAIASVEGLHLTCDFVVYSAALFGCPPDYSPTPAGLHEAFREPYDVLCAVPFANYDELGDECSIDSITLEALKCVTAQRMKDLTPDPSIAEGMPAVGG